MVSLAAKDPTGSRHSDLLGKMGEYLAACWFSRAGWEVAHVDQVGIDLIASRGGRRVGVSVKSRYHNEKMKGAGVNVFSGKKESRTKIMTICKEFGVEPWLAVYHETRDRAQLIVMSVATYDDPSKGYNTRKPKAPDDMKTAAAWLAQYRQDPDVGIVEFDFRGPSGKVLRPLPRP